MNKQNLNVSQYSFKHVDNFKYLNVSINANNNMHKQINFRITAANQGIFFAIN